MKPHSGPAWSRTDPDSRRPSSPSRLCSLNLRARGAPGREDYSRFPGLAFLCVHNDPGFTGASLPDSLRTLHVGQCPQFRSEFLERIPLERLHVGDCQDFTSHGLPLSLQQLRVINGPRVGPASLLETVRRLTSLRTLAYWAYHPFDQPRARVDWSPFSPHFLNHPALVKVPWSYRPMFTWQAEGQPRCSSIWEAFGSGTEGSQPVWHRPASLEGARQKPKKD